MNRNLFFVFLIIVITTAVCIVRGITLYVENLGVGEITVEIYFDQNL